MRVPVVVGQHPGGGRADAVGRRDATRRSSCAQRAAADQRRGEEVEVERLVQLVGADVAGQPLRRSAPTPRRPPSGRRGRSRGSSARRGRCRARRPGRSRAARSRPSSPIWLRRRPTVGRPAALTMPWATSMRKPSTPRSSQNRSTSSNSARTSGLSQLRSGWAGSNRCRYHSPSAVAGPGGAAEDGLPVVRRLAVGRGRRGRGTGRAPASRGRRRAPPGTTRARGGVVGHDVDDDADAQRVRRRRASRRSRRACRTAGRRRGSRRRRSRRRPCGER